VTLVLVWFCQVGNMPVDSLPVQCIQTRPAVHRIERFAVLKTLLLFYFCLLMGMIKGIFTWYLKSVFFLTCLLVLSEVVMLQVVGHITGRVVSLHGCECGYKCLWNIFYTGCTLFSSFCNDCYGQTLYPFISNILCLSYVLYLGICKNLLEESQRNKP